MKKEIFLIIISTFLFGTVVLAQETELLAVSQVELPDPGLLPDSPFYFLDTLGEKIGIFFTFGAEKKAERALKIAEEKIAEVKAMAEKNNISALETANQKYQEFLTLANQKVSEAKRQGKDMEELAVMVVERTTQHQDVLAKVLEKVPEAAKKAIEKVIEVSRRGSEEALKVISGAEKEKLLQKILLQKVEEAKTEEVNGKTEEKVLPLKEELKSEAKPEVQKAEEEIVLEPSAKAEPNLVLGKTLKERLDEAYARLHTQGSGRHIRDNFPDIELVYTDKAEGIQFPPEILPFRYYYSSEADTTFNICAVEFTVFICKGKLDRLIKRSDVRGGNCELIYLYSNDSRLDQ